MKYNIGVLLVLFLFFNMTFVLGSPMDVYRVRGYIDDDRISADDFDESGGEVEISPGDKFEVHVYIRNNNDTRKIEDIVVEFKIDNIDDGDDIEAETSEFDINPGENEKKILDFTIPFDVEEDYYSAILKVSGIYYNGSENVELIETYEYNFEVNFDKLEEEKETLLKRTLINFTNTVSVIKSDIEVFNNLSKKIDKQIDECTNCPGQLIACEEKYNKCIDVDLHACKEEKTITNADVSGCEEKLDVCVIEKEKRITRSLCTKEKNEAIIEATAEGSKSTRLVDIVVGGIIAGFVYFKYFKKKKIIGPGGRARSDIEFPERRE